MNHPVTNYTTVLLLFWTMLSCPAFAQEFSTTPSYKQALKNFQAERKNDPNAPIPSQADRLVIDQAAENLDAILPKPGLKIGDKAPDFILPNAFGKPVRLSDELETGPVVLTFYRGAWCPYCNLELHTLHAALPHFRRYGAQLIAITPQTPDKSLDQINNDGYPFEILSDLDSSVMKAYRLYFEVTEELSNVYRRSFALDLAEYNGMGRYVLPVPGTYVIDTDGIVRAAYAETDYKKRMEPNDIIAALQTLQGR